MRLSIRFFTTLREIVNKKEETLSFTENQVTIDTVLGKLSKQYGKVFVAYVFDAGTGNVKSFLQFLVNGKSAATGEGLKTVLHDGDVLAILPPVGGG